MDERGSFEEGDSPMEISKIRMKPQDDKIYFKIKWNRRKNGFQPKSSYVSNQKMKVYDPRFLVDYYEQNMCLITRSHPISKEKNKSTKGLAIKKRTPSRARAEDIEMKRIVSERKAHVETTTKDKEVKSVRVIERKEIVKDNKNEEYIRKIVKDIVEEIVCTIENLNTFEWG